MDGRPFMGPNLHKAPPGAFTSFHQVGHGTVDSSHLNIEGFNEVIMMRRMDEIHKRHALYLLTCGDRRKGVQLEYDALYGSPHQDVSARVMPFSRITGKCILSHVPSFLIYSGRKATLAGSYCHPKLQAVQVSLL